MHWRIGWGTGLGIFSQEYNDSEKNDVVVGTERKEGQLVEKKEEHS